MKRLIFAFLLLLAAPASLATIALVQHTNNRCAALNTCSVTLSSVASGDLIVVEVIENSSGQSLSSITDSNGTVSAAVTYAVITGNVGAGIYYVANAASGTHTINVTLSPNNSNILLFAAEFSSAATSSPFDLASALAPSTTSASITPSGSNELIIGLGDVVGSGFTLSSWGSGMTPQDSSNGGPSAAWADVVQTSALSADSSYTATGSATWLSVVAAFKPASAPGCTNPGQAKNGSHSVPNGTSGSYWGKSGNWVTPDCASVYYWSPGIGEFVTN